MGASVTLSFAARRLGRGRGAGAQLRRIFSMSLVSLSRRVKESKLCGFRPFCRDAVEASEERNSRRRPLIEEMPR